MRVFLCFVGLSLAALSLKVQASSLEEGLAQFNAIYQAELGEARVCSDNEQVYRLCSSVLKNEGNAPYILHHGVPTANVVVLFHGLSDSPFFFRDIAQSLYQQGANVVVALLPGHGLKDADDDMEDWDLAERWASHVAQVSEIAPKLGNKLFVGGFSTGGALATQYYLAEENRIDGLMLFSSALALSQDAEDMSNIWGIKLVALLVDGHYETDGPNPYKYPGVAGFAGMELMEVINAIRDQLALGKKVEVPLFIAHSQDDVTTPIWGVENLIEHSNGGNTFFVIDKSYELCHADVVVSPSMLSDMAFDESKLEQPEKCAIPQANPLYKQMIATLQSFVEQYGASSIQ